MQSTTLLASIGILAAVIGGPALAADRDHNRHERPPVADTRAAVSSAAGMQAVRHNAGADEPGYGWQYFTDPAAGRAVVISPQGDYYLSRGKGLRWVTGPQKGA